MQERLWNLLHDQDEVVTDVMGTEVRLIVVKPSDEDEIVREIETDHELREMMNRSEDDIREGRVYTAKQAIEYLTSEQPL